MNNYVQHAYNQALHSSTQRSPFEFSFGYLPKSPLDFVFGKDDDYDEKIDEEKA